MISNRVFFFPWRQEETLYLLKYVNDAMVTKYVDRCSVCVRALICKLCGVDDRSESLQALLELKQGNSSSVNA